MTAWIDARFRSRPNRFLIRAVVQGRIVRAFLANPGRLTEILRPGVGLRLVPADRWDRSTRYDVLAVRADDGWVCLDTRLANDAVGRALRDGRLPEVQPFRTIRPEAPWDGDRFDFLLEGPGRCWLEVKTVSLVVDGLALFPDAPTGRGTRHLRGLARLVRRGDRAAVLFVVVRDASCLAPNEAADPAFAEALRDASQAGVGILARRAVLQGRRLRVGRRIPTVL